MRDLNGPAVVRGVVDPTNHQPIEFRNQQTGFAESANPEHDGTFRVLLPQGNYTVRQGAARTTLTVISAGTYDVDLRREKAVDFAVATESDASDDIVLRVTARGIGSHTFSIRADNLDLTEAPQQTVDLTSEKAGDTVWHAHIRAAETPWVAVVIADNALGNRREVTGTAHLHATPAN
jgi:hypothetical protein